MTKKVTTPVGDVKREPLCYAKRRTKDRMHLGFVVLLVLFGLLKIASAEPRTPVPEELQYLEESNRGEWQMPERVIDALRLQKSESLPMLVPVRDIFRVASHGWWRMFTQKMSILRLCAFSGERRLPE